MTRGIVSPARRAMRVVAAPSTAVARTTVGGGGPPFGRGLGFGCRGRCFHFGLLSLGFRFDRFFWFTGRGLFDWLTDRSRNFGWLGGAKSRGAFLRLGLPIGAAEAFGSGEIPPAGIPGISRGFKVARQFERNHGIASFGEKIRQLCRGVFSGTCSADSRGDLLPVSHTVKAF